jgi:hypothetical protein
MDIAFIKGRGAGARTFPGPVAGARYKEPNSKCKSESIRADSQGGTASTIPGPGPAGAPDGRLGPLEWQLKTRRPRGAGQKARTPRPRTLLAHSSGPAVTARARRQRHWQPEC